MPPLDALQLEATLAHWERRIVERDPGAPLASLCGELRQIVRNAPLRTREWTLPHVGLRIVIALLCLLIACGAIVTLLRLGMPLKVDDFAQLVQAIESGMNDIVYVAIAIFLLLLLETRWKRRRALAALHALRLLAHRIDSSLSGDPEAPAGGDRLERSAGNEMLATVGKIAALYSEKCDDAVVLHAAGEIQMLVLALRG
jgi:hypothetical protein